MSSVRHKRPQVDRLKTPDEHPRQDCSAALRRLSPSPPHLGIRPSRLNPPSPAVATEARLLCSVHIAYPPYTRWRTQPQQRHHVLSDLATVQPLSTHNNNKKKKKQKKNKGCQSRGPVLDKDSSPPPKATRKSGLLSSPVALAPRVFDHLGEAGEPTSTSTSPGPASS